MKQFKLFFLVLCLATYFGSCGNSGGSSESKDTTGSKIIPPPSDNSSATNPSLADTAYPSKDTMKTHGDSVRAGKK